MRNIYITMLLTSFTFSSYSQETFIRLFNSVGSKIGKGELIGTTDSTIVLSGKTTFEIKYNNIGSIKTKHTLGHSILNGAILFGASATLIGLAAYSSIGTISSTSSTSSGLVVAVGLAIGGTAGAAIGGIIGGLRNTNTLFVNGHFAEWQKVKLQLDKLLVKRVKYEPSLW